MQITYTFSNIGSVLSATIQELNRHGGIAGRVGLACSLASNVSHNSLTVNCVRADAKPGWSDEYGLLVTVLQHH